MGCGEREKVIYGKNMTSLSIFQTDPGKRGPRSGA
jgi:hypothetical protein